jgi:CRP-like cAMP-binding protein
LNAETSLRSASANSDLPGKIANYSKKEVIFQPFSLSQNLYRIQSGKIKLYKNSEEGRKTILTMLGEGDFFSNIARFSLDDEGVYAEAIDETILTVISLKQLDSFSVSQPAFLAELFYTFNQHMKQRNMFLERIMYAPVKERILYLMSFLMKNFGEKQGRFMKLTVPLTHQDIASFIGSTSETVTSLTKELITEGHIQKKDKHYLVMGGTDL